MNIQAYYAACYYVAELDEPDEWGNGWGHEWFPEIDEWCTNTFGESDLWGEEPKTGWKRMRARYCFTEEKTREWFILKWA